MTEITLASCDLQTKWSVVFIISIRDFEENYFHLVERSDLK